MLVEIICDNDVRDMPRSVQLKTHELENVSIGSSTHIELVKNWLNLHFLQTFYLQLKERVSPAIAYVTKVAGKRWRP